MKKQKFFKWIRRVIWRFLILLYAPLLYTLDGFEALLVPECGNTRERTNITLKMYWYRY